MSPDEEKKFRREVDFFGLTEHVFAKPEPVPMELSVHFHFVTNLKM